jgi:organic hydroperoxide reductase OsmC/OhrA
MIQSHDYPVRVSWMGEKRGVLESEDRLPPLPVVTPPEFGGHQGEWSPEHLFVASVASCLMTTFLAVAEISRLEIHGFEAAAVGTLERGDDRRYRFTRVVLRPRVAVAREQDRERAVRLLEKSEQACLITRSITCEVELEPTVEIGPREEAPTPAG